ncbi:MAG: hypothetical protein ACHQJ4_04735, partial [Ignavibacteria bacterium]
LTEGSGAKYKCIIIKAGMTETANAVAEVDGNKIPIYKNYTEHALKNAVSNGLFENIPALFRSEEEHLQCSNTGIDRYIGTFNEVKWNDEAKQVEGVLNLKSGGEAVNGFKKMLNSARKKIKNVGLSISGMGKYVIQKINDKYTALVTEIDSLQSIDPVALGNAGGKLVALVESAYRSEQLSNNISKKMPEERGKNYNNMDEDLKQKLTDFLDKTNDAAGLKDTVNEAKVLLCEAQLEKSLAKSSLPQIVKDKVKKQYEGKIFEPKDLEDTLKEEQKIIAELNPVNVNNSGADIKGGMDGIDKAVKQLEFMMLSPLAKSKLTESQRNEYKNSGVDSGMMSIKEWYRNLTGDYHVSGIRETGKGILTEAMKTSDLASIFKNALNKSMVSEYTFSAYNNDWRKLVSEIVPRQDFKENTVTRIGGYANLPVVDENSAYGAATSPDDQEITYSIRKRGYIETITREMIVNDDLGAIRKIPVRMGQAAARTIYEFVFDLILSNPTMDYDSVNLFHANHGGNLLSTALDAASFENARKIMRSQTELSSGKKIGINPRYLLVPCELDKTAYELTTVAFGLSNPVPDFHQTWKVEPITIAHTTDANNWYMVADPYESPTIEIGFLHGMEEPELFVSDLPTQGSYFTNDQIRYKIRHEYDGDVLDHRSFVGAIVA